jgi:CheY-like chemotaxis protein
MGTSICNLDLSSKKIVIVEDDFYSIKYYEMLLANTGADIHIFKSGFGFVEYIKDGDRDIDFIFMDFLIPYITGVECIKIYRKTNRTTPIVMLTAYASEMTKTEAFLAGCNEYVMKPIYGEKLSFLLEKYLINSSVADLVI